jgi:hypothetical protein
MCDCSRKDKKDSSGETTDRFEQIFGGLNAIP